MGVRCVVRRLFCCCLAALILGGCARQPAFVPTAGTRLEDRAHLARVEEDSQRPVLLRGVDGSMLGSYRLPTPFFPYQYLVPPGWRVL
jgi:hypothetical protein